MSQPETKFPGTPQEAYDGLIKVEPRYAHSLWRLAECVVLLRNPKSEVLDRFYRTDAGKQLKDALAAVGVVDEFVMVLDAALDHAIEMMKRSATHPDEAAALLKQVPPDMAYRLFCERDPSMMVALNQSGELVALGMRKAEEVVDAIIDGMTPENRQYAADHPNVRSLLIKATEHASTLYRQTQARIKKRHTN
jgi:hypothetical protein